MNILSPKAKTKPQKTKTLAAEGDENTLQYGRKSARYLPLFIMLHDVKPISPIK